MKQNFYSTGQAAKLLEVSSYRIRRLCETGVFPGAEYTEGKQWLIPAAEAEKMKRDGVPPTPRTVDTDTDTERPRKDTVSTTTLLAAPSAAMVGAAEEAEISGRQLTVAKNKLEQNRVAKEETEIEDFFEGRAKRLGCSNETRHQ
jgi:hypothetical protein